MDYAILCIFTPAGKTFTFRNVHVLADNETVLHFSYTAMSDGRTKTATFPKSTICGWSLTSNELSASGAEQPKQI